MLPVFKKELHYGSTCPIVRSKVYFIFVPSTTMLVHKSTDLLKPRFDFHKGCWWMLGVRKPLFIFCKGCLSVVDPRQLLFDIRKGCLRDGKTLINRISTSTNLLPSKIQSSVIKFGGPHEIRAPLPQSPRNMEPPL